MLHGSRSAAAVVAVAAVLAPAAARPALAGEPVVAEAAGLGRIVNGQLAGTCAFASTVMLYSDEPGGGTSVCSGSLVHPSIVVYAGHCGDSVGRVFFGENVLKTLADGNWEVDRPARTIAMPKGACHVYPGHEPYNGTDFAYCKLPTPVTDVPIVPILMGCETAILGARQPIYIAGFGQDDALIAGIKRFAATTAYVAANNKIELGGPMGSTCHGDSGGPAFVQLPATGSLVPGGDDSWRVFGITSFGTDLNTCAAPSYFSLMYNAVPWIEASSGIDISACGDAYGVWGATSECTGFPTDLLQVKGDWTNGCQLTGPRSGASSTCGAAYDSRQGGLQLLEPADDDSTVAGQATQVVVDVGTSVGAQSVRASDAIAVTLDGQRLVLVDDSRAPRLGFGPVVWTPGAHALVISVDGAGGAGVQRMFTVTIRAGADAQGTIAGDPPFAFAGAVTPAGCAAAPPGAAPMVALAVLGRGLRRRRTRGRPGAGRRRRWGWMAIAGVLAAASCGGTKGGGSAASPGRAGSGSVPPSSLTTEVVEGAASMVGGGQPAATVPDVPPASAQITGSVAGQPVPSTEVLFTYGYQDPDALLFIYMADQTRTCTRQLANQPLVARGRELRLQLRSAAGGDEPPVSGTYQVVPLARINDVGGDYAAVNYLVSDGSCGNTLSPAQAYAASGTVQVETQVSAKGAYLKGTLTDVQFPSGDMLAGTFVALPCSIEGATNDIVKSCR